MSLLFLLGSDPTCLLFFGKTADRGLRLLLFSPELCRRFGQSLGFLFLFRLDFSGFLGQSSGLIVLFGLDSSHLFGKSCGVTFLFGVKTTFFFGQSLSVGLELFPLTSCRLFHTTRFVVAFCCCRLETSRLFLLVDQRDDRFGHYHPHGFDDIGRSDVLGFLSPIRHYINRNDSSRSRSNTHRIIVVGWILLDLFLVRVCGCHHGTLRLLLLLLLLLTKGILE